jgi:RNA 3'-terminal phosphate cyclase
MVLAGAGRFRTSLLSRHTTTNIDVIAHLMDVAIDLAEEPKRVWTVSLTRKLHDAVAGP